jgi:hypothetical protein
MMRMVKLRAGQGADEANFAGDRYRVNNDKTVMVDEGAVDALLQVGGFVRADPPGPVEVPHGNVQVQHRSDPTTVVSWGGQTYVPDADGILVLPLESLPAIRPHGFEVISTTA